MAAWTRGGGSSLPPLPAGLDEGQLHRLAEEAHAAVQQGSMEVEAESAFQAELQKWRRATQDAADREDFVLAERLSEVTNRFAKILEDIESSVSGSRSASGTTTPAQSVSPPPAPGPESGRKHKKEKKHSKDRERSRHLDRDEGSHPVHNWGNMADLRQGGAGGQPSFGTDPAQPAFDASQEPAQVACGWAPGDPGGFQQPGGGFPGGTPQQGFAGYPSQPPAYDGGRAPPQSGFASGSWGPRPAEDVHGGCGSPPPSSFPSGPSGAYGYPGTPGAMPEGQGRLQEPPGTACGGSPTSLHMELQRALRRVRELEPLQMQLADASATCSALREANEQLQGEVDQLQHELREAKRQLATAQDQIREREEVISETRQRLFDSKHRTVQLEDEVKNQSEVQQVLQGRLQSVRQHSASTETQLRTLRHTLQSAADWRLSRTEAHRPLGNVSYTRSLQSLDLSSIAGTAEVQGPSSPRRVNESDELATARPPSPRQEGSPTDLPLQQLARRSRAAAGAHGEFAGGTLHTVPPLTSSVRPQLPTIARSHAETWHQTPRISRLPPALVAQPPPSMEVALRTHENFRRLLVETRGMLYEDRTVQLEVAISVDSSVAGRPCIRLDMLIVNCGSHGIHEVTCRAAEPSRTHACELKVDVAEVQGAGGRGRGSASLARQQRVRLRGQLAVFGPFEAVPQLELSYLLPDDLGLKARVRLPLGVTRLMAAPKSPPDPKGIVELWDSPNFGHTEVAFACNVRGDLLGAGAPFSVWRCLELGGAFRCLPGLDENPRGTIMVSLYPQRQGTPSEVLLRVELGGPSGPGGLPFGSGASLPYGDGALCRVAVRSASNLVNRAVAQVALEAICELQGANVAG